MMLSSEHRPIVPLRPTSGKYPTLTARRAAFAREFVLNGGRRRDAALAAGYAPGACHVEANRLLRNPDVLKAVQAETERALCASVAVGHHVLLGLAENATSEAVRLQAAQALLDRGGMQIVKRTEQTINVVDSRSDAELMAQVQRLAGGLGMVIDGATLIRDRPPSTFQIEAPTPQTGSARLSMGSSLPAAKNWEGSISEPADHEVVFD